MTMVAAMDTPTAAMPNAAMLARVDVIGDFASAEALWRSFENGPTLSTPYQRFDLQSAWYQHVGAKHGIQPAIIVARDAARLPLMLLPLGVGRENGIRVARYLGGKHITFNMPLFNRDFAARANAADMAALLRGLRAQPAAIDVLALLRQPQSWRGVANPMALLPRQVSTNDCPVLNIAPGAAPTARISQSFRKRLRTKEGKYRNVPGFRYLQAGTPAEIARVLDAFFAMKPLRMAELGLPNVFAEPGVEAFLREACATPRADGYAIDIHALVCDEEVIAMFAGVADDHRYSMMFNTYTLSEHAKYSPGLILLRSIIDAYAERGVTALDLGIGGDDYKRMFCKDDEPLFDSFLPLTARGRLGAIGLSTAARAKRLVKQTPAVLRVAQLMRRAVRR